VALWGLHVQTTLKTSVAFDGVGLHSGQPVRMVVRPAPAGHGISFVRSDLAAPGNAIAARWDQVVPSRLCTLLRNGAGAEVSTVEHVMAALAGCGIHNAKVDIDAREVPILDGSAAPFVNSFLAAGLVRQNVPVRAIRILEPIEVREGDASARLEPAASFQMDFRIDFNDDAIGVQHLVLDMANGAFVRELANCRTFCRKADVDVMQANGLALGGTLENAVVIDGARVLSPGGLRIADEPVRHKMLDALGDLLLAGGPILGRYSGNRAGHALTNRLLRALFAAPGAWQLVSCDADMAASLPGVGLKPADLCAIA